ncbi:LLM class flavin-dependent oxidoreductase [Subsaximicrobium wynnwilliamsii]|uniref:Luciferase-like monooxygenase n=1 Tax=Subsaximicrobium wynnwilliamsii TaxID=291179 RepID=A0A5C6ZFS5_9FLAO|nr:LLM class flavin-dependent oxidoreductase [Subsaximicrobium wynnwilliamsii]TXD84085.1 LLM class flavin-dependent oxidoreductase [Subsaximicrobium wynnwilliamsii]TXD88957.1 LLM class flavin-dependent oxidoreductase [Subsaximicrobium wynnwilliamsii]TXE03797.1 LLM class flavin-dependent oxidoreductase [Subsaximicrobium wynnwilliamsii]
MKIQPTLYSILDLALVSEGHTLKQTYTNVLELAQHAEASGYTRYWLAEHHNAPNIGSSATSILIGYVAEGTKTLRIGSGGIMLPNHSPLIVAEQFGTLASLYPNRIDLGLGRAPGTDRETAQAIRSDFMQAAHSFPKELDKIETYFSAENASSKVRATVAEGVDVPIYILGSSTDSAHLAAKKGLPYAFASHFATTHLMEAIGIYRDEFQASNELQTPYVMAGVNIIVADTDEEAERLSTSLIRMIVGIFTGKRDYVQAPTAMTDELKEIMQHPQVHQMLKYSFIGSKATVKAQVKAFMAKTQADELIAVTNIYDGQERIRSYELFAEIMKELNA